MTKLTLKDFFKHVKPGEISEAGATPRFLRSLCAEDASRFEEDELADFLAIAEMSGGELVVSMLEVEDIFDQLETDFPWLDRAITTEEKEIVSKVLKDLDDTFIIDTNNIDLLLEEGEDSE